MLFSDWTTSGGLIRSPAANVDNLSRMIFHRMDVELTSTRPGTLLQERSEQKRSKMYSISNSVRETLGTCELSLLFDREPSSIFNVQRLPVHPLIFLICRAHKDFTGNCHYDRCGQLSLYKRYNHGGPTWLKMKALELACCDQFVIETKLKFVCSLKIDVLCPKLSPNEGSSRKHAHDAVNNATVSTTKAPPASIFLWILLLKSKMSTVLVFAKNTHIVLWRNM